jgi:hypothetical protein
LKVVIVVLAGLMFVLNMHFLWTVQLVERAPDGANVTNCEASPRHVVLVNEAWPWVDAAIYSFVPFLVILVLNVLIVSEVVHAHNHRQRMQHTPEHRFQSTRVGRGGGGGGGGGAASCGGWDSGTSLTLRSPVPPSPRSSTSCRRPCGGRGDGSRLTVMLLTVSFSFLLTTLPMNACNVALAFFQPRSLHNTVRFQLAKTVAELLMYVNHSCNFFLYCATGRKFRQQLRRLLTCNKDRNPSATWASLQMDDSRLQVQPANNGHKVSNGHRLGGRSKHKQLLAVTVPSERNSSNGSDTPPRPV